MKILGEETIPLARQRYFVGHIDSREAWGYPEHTHRGWGEFLFVARGRIDHHANGTRTSLPAGSLTLIREPDVHRLDTADHCHFNLNVPQADWPRVAGFIDRGDRLLELLAAPQPPVAMVPAAARQELADQLRRLFLLQETARGTDLYQRVLAELCCLITTQPGARRARSEPPLWLSDAVALCEGSLPDLDPARLARRLGVSHEHLARTFARHLGTSPSTYLARCRVRRAAEALINSDRPVLDIGLAVGFNSPSHFYRWFQTVFAMAPGDYRKREQR